MSRKIKENNMHPRSQYPEITSCKDETGEYIQFDRPKNFDIHKIFDCGQTFRFDPCENGVAGIAHDIYVHLVQDDKTVKIYGCTQEDYHSFFAHYLSLDRDYDEINNDIFSHFPKGVIQQAQASADGIRILAQPLWETVCSFIISQNNNIPRIKKIITSLCETYGDEIKCFDGKTRYTFPSADKLILCGEEGLRELKTGFRAKYMIDAAEKWQAGIFEHFETLSYDEAKAALLSVKGIGEKVANCILLFSCEMYGAFPVDVWIKRVIDKYYGGELNTNSLGAYAGVAQQYLFYYERYINQKKDD